MSLIRRSKHGAARTAFRHDGYLVIADAIEPAALDALDDASQRLWDTGDVMFKPGYPGWAQHTREPLPADVSPERLCRPAAAEVIRTLLRSDPFAADRRGSFAARSDELRIPAPQYAYVAPDPVGTGLNAHVDGDLEDGRLTTMAALVGVLLHDVAERGAGSFLFRPGAHIEAHRALVRAGDTGALAALGGINAALAVGPDYRPLLGRRGTIIVCHRLLPHAVAPNRTATVRRMAYFRIDARGFNFDDSGRRLSPEPTAADLAENRTITPPPASVPWDRG